MSREDDECTMPVLATMTTVFLSHASADKIVVRQIAADLMAMGVSVWLDERELLPGATLVSGLSEGLGSADYVFLFVSAAFLNSQWASVEMDVAIKKAVETRRGTVIPLLLEDVWHLTPPLLQALLYQDFREAQNVLSYRHALRRLLAAIRHQGSQALPPTTRRIAVLVSGGRSETGGEFGLRIARQLGRALVAEE